MRFWRVFDLTPAISPSQRDGERHFQNGFYVELKLIVQGFENMRYLVLSDVHGNRFGLEAAIEHARGAYDRVFCLGDVVGYGAHPNECCQILRDLEAHCLLGNHDAAALGQIDISWFNAVATAAILWTREQLSPENRAWLAGLSPTYENRFQDFQAVHASLRQPIEEYIIEPSIAQPNLALMTRSLCFYGHTHVGDCYRGADVQGRTQMQHSSTRYGGTIALESGWKYLVNPGSCGQPRDGNPQTRYALFDVESREVEVHALDYDVESARDAIFAAGLPRALGERLINGE